MAEKTSCGPSPRSDCIDVHSLRTAYVEGLSLRELARRTGLSRPTITRRLSEAGITPRSARVCLPVDPRWWELQLAEGVSVPALAAQYATSTMTIYRHLARLGLRRSLPVPFELWVNARTETVGDCLVWTGPHTREGYPTGRRDGVATIATRLVWQQLHGDIPEGSDVTHVDECLRRSCVRGEHLRLLTSQDRGATRASRASSPRGEGHWNAKLTEADARFVLSSSQSAEDLGARLGVTTHTVNAIRAGRRWAWLQAE